MSKELSVEQLAVLNESYPVEVDSSKLTLPRLGMLSKDIIKETGSGKTKKISVVQSAGTFYTEKDLGEVDEDGKKKWTKEYIEGETIDVIIVYHRRQLRMFDASLEKFISSPIYDNGEQVIPLYLDRQQIKKGTQAELQACYPALTQKGKPSSKLKEETILYVLYNGELHQMNLSQSSKWLFKDYSKKLNPSTVITTLGSVEDEFGTNVYRKVTFKNKRIINGSEFDTVVESQGAVKEAVKSDEKFYLGSGEDSKAEDDIKNFG